jgi:hypothetical protein
MCGSVSFDNSPKRSDLCESGEAILVSQAVIKSVGKFADGLLLSIRTEEVNHIMTNVL